MKTTDRPLVPTLLALACASALSAGTALASSHREAPLITGTPKIDGTDFYMFRSYEAGRAGFVTFIANYQPFQDPQCGPNCNMMDTKAVYSIHVDNNGDAMADRVFQFRFIDIVKNLTVPVNGVNVAVPLQNIGPFNEMTRANLNTTEAYYVVTENGRASNLTVGGGVQQFTKPFDNIGNKSIANYAQYANAHIAAIGLPGCATPGRVFVGQRKESFFVNVGELLDLINTNPLGPTNAEQNDLERKNVTSIALEVPIACLTNGSEQVIGAWTTAKLDASNVQLSRLSHPLVNEVVIGLPDKNKFNNSVPSGDGQFAQYVTNPTLPELIQILYPSVTAPNLFPRTDLVSVFLTGLAGLNKPTNVVAAEMLRLNTAVAPKAANLQNNLGVIAGDNAGFPNGRRPGDDVVDIELRVLMGKLLTAAEAPSGQLPFTDGVSRNAATFASAFPYLRAPLPGSPNATP